MGDIKDLIMKEGRRNVLMNMLGKGERLDGRDFNEYRPISVQKGVADTAEGSAVAQIGNTKVLAAVKITSATPFPDRPEEGIFITSAEFLQLADPTFEGGPPREDAIELARVVDRGIRSAEIIDTGSFFIEEGKVLALFLDLYVLDNRGNLMDTAGLAAAAALKDTKIPKVEDGQLIMGEVDRDLNPPEIPVPTTFVKIGHYWVVDPLKDEENVADSRLTITTTSKHVCTMQKAQGVLAKEELLNNINISFNIGKDIRKYL
ncbi:exosome complex protein Rrp42 [Candidatus Micrarchaeota archaeon]|nr:exosome complex protein Rrp42 [Candidatus Micrarchaeota archaeon]